MTTFTDCVGTRLTIASTIPRPLPTTSADTRYETVANPIAVASTTSMATIVMAIARSEHSRQEKLVPYMCVLLQIEQSATKKIGTYRRNMPGYTSSPFAETTSKVKPASLRHIGNFELVVLGVLC